MKNDFNDNLLVNFLMNLPSREFSIILEELMADDTDVEEWFKLKRRIYKAS